MNEDVVNVVVLHPSAPIRKVVVEAFKEDPEIVVYPAASAEEAQDTLRRRMVFNVVAVGGSSSISRGEVADLLRNVTRRRFF